MNYTDKSLIDAYFTSISSATKLNLCRIASLPTLDASDNLLVADMVSGSGFAIADITITGAIFTRSTDTLLLVDPGSLGVAVNVVNGGVIYGIVLHDGTNVIKVCDENFTVATDSYITIGSTSITYSEE